MKKLTKDNCLATINPKVASEWHPNKNGDLTPLDVAYASNKRVWWKCKKGHEWFTTINHRSAGGNCPYCAGKKACKDNCLATVNLKLAKEWNCDKNGELTPYDVVGHSDKKVWWKCKKGHEWRAKISNRSHGKNCPYCGNKKVNMENCFATKKSKLIEEWHKTKNGELTPYTVTCGTPKKVWWQCKKGHEWIDSVAHRSDGRGCPYCSSRKLSEDNCLFTVYPQLAKEWNYDKNGNLIPQDVFSSSSRKVWWKCKNGHEWKTSVNSRNGGEVGCPHCNKVYLNDGAICDSYIEAFYYLRFKQSDKIFKQHGYYGGKLGKSKYDFYFPDANKYIEVTSYDSMYERWGDYIRNIRRKQKYVEKILRAQFLFIQKKLTRKEKRYVLRNCVKP